MGFVASRLNLRLFIDGMEVPIIGARVTYTEGGPSTAQIQVVATDQVYDILPRSLLTVFYYETHDYDRSSGFTLKKYGPKDPRRWKLLWMGELTGVNFSKQSAQRSATLLGMDITNYWDFIKQHYVNFANGGVELFENAFMGVKMDRIKNYDVTTKDAYSNIYVWLTQSTFTDDDGTKQSSLYFGVQRILREMFFASNNFYAQQFNRHRMGDQIVGLPQDKTAGKLFKLNFFEKFIKGQLGGSGGMVSMRQLIETLLGTVFHTYVTVPCPYFDPLGATKGFSPDPSKEEEKTIAQEIMDRNAWPYSSLNYIVIKPDTWFLDPPACNIIFPHQYNTLDYQRNFLQEPTRLFMRTSLIFTGRDKWLTERFYAPDFESFNQLLYAEGGYLRRMATILLPHEEFVGLNPVMAWQEDLGAFAQKGARREYLARLSDYLFWKYRFGTRTANLAMPFNPNLLPGYPALVMDRTGVPGTISRHFMGNIQTLVHSIDQTGGWTHITMVGARVHDESVDFDGNARSLQEVTSRGTDGFLDDRYDYENIGEQVYQPLFGIGSLHDLTSSSLNVDEEENQDLIAQLEESLGDIEDTGSDLLLRVAYVQRLYQLAQQNSVDINSFTQSITQRPKANLTEILGLYNITTASGVSTSEDNQVQNYVIEEIYAEHGEEGLEGFIGPAVDTDCSDLAENDSFVARHTTYNYVPEEVQEVDESKSGEQVVGTEIKQVTVYKPKKTVVKAVPSTKETQGSYRLEEHLVKRREKVQAYLDSLRYRGLRG
jgi:hypothetical protein